MNKSRSTITVHYEDSEGCYSVTRNGATIEAVRKAISDLLILSDTKPEDMGTMLVQHIRSGAGVSIRRYDVRLEER